MSDKFDTSTDQTWASSWIAKYQDILEHIEDNKCYAGKAGMQDFLADGLAGDLPWSDRNQAVCDAILIDPKFPALKAAFAKEYGESDTLVKALGPEALADF